MMKQNVKLWMFSGLGWLGFVAFVYIASQMVMLKSFAGQEILDNRRNVSRSLDSIHEEVDRLDRVTLDWSSWDDTYEFVVGNQPEYLDVNLVDRTFVDLKIGFCYIANMKGEEIFSKAVDLDSGTPYSFPSSLKQALAVGTPLMAKAKVMNGNGGVVMLPEGPVLLNVRMIRDSEGIASPRGYFVFGRLVDKRLNREVTTKVHLQTDIYLLNNTSLPQDVQDALAHIHPPDVVTDYRTTPTQLFSYTLVTDLYEKPAFLIRIVTPRDFYNNARRAVEYFVLLTGITALLFMVLSIRQIERIRTSHRAQDEAQQQLRQSQERYQTLVETLPDLVWEVNCDLEYTYVSPQVKAVLGFDPGQALGKSVLGITAEEDRPRVAAYLARILQTGEVIKSREILVCKAGGEKVTFEVNGAPVYLPSGEIGGYRGVARDISERKHAEQARLELETRFRAVAETMREVFFILDAETQKPLYLNPAYETVWGRSRESAYSGEQPWLDAIHPEDRSILAENLKMQGSAAHHKHFISEFRVIQPEGYVRWVRGSMSFTPREEGLRMVGVMEDITERKAAESRLQRAEARYRQLVEQINAITYIDAVDETSSNLYMSPQCEVLLGYTPEEWLADPDLWERTIHPDDRARVMGEHQRTNQNGDDFRMEYRMVTKGGRTIWVHDDAVLVPGDGEHPPIWNGVMYEITDQKTMEEELRFIGSHDAMTNLYNRSYFNARLQRLQHSPAEFPVSVFMTDVDGLKIVNDTQGHAAGDELLKAAARFLSQSFRPQDIIARIGGDEFAVILPLTDDVAAQSILARIHRRLACFNRKHPEAGLSLSMGVSTAPDNTAPLEETVQRADGIMYAEKAQKKQKAAA